MKRLRLPLLGSDLIFLGLARGRAGSAALVLELAGRIEKLRLEAALAALEEHAPYGRSRLRRPFPWGRLHWAVRESVSSDTSRLEHRLVVGPDGFRAELERLLERPMDLARQPPLRWILVEDEASSTSWLVVLWTHVLMDPRGAELLVAMLAVYAGDSLDEGLRASVLRQRVVAPVEKRAPFRTRLETARRALGELRTLGVDALPSLGSRPGRPGKLRYRRFVRAAGEPRIATRTLAYAAAAIVPCYERRGTSLNGRFLVPVSVDRRRKGDLGPVFGNYLSFHFARVRPPGDGEAEAVATEVRRDMIDALRRDAIESLWVAMDFARYQSPTASLRPIGKEVASFYCADTGAVRPCLTSFLGVSVRAAYHVPSVQAEPGLGIFFSSFAGRESVVFVWREGTVDEEEIGEMLAALEPVLGSGEPVASSDAPASRVLT